MNHPPDPNQGFFTQLKDQKKISPVAQKPFFCDLLISEKCNLKCRTCYFWKHGLDDALTFDECKEFILSLKGLVKAPFEINLGGGEPLLNKRILDLVKCCVEEGLQPSISTNATLIDEEMAIRLSSSGLHRLSISLEGMRQDTHDFITGTSGSYARLMQAIGYLKKYWKKGDFNIHTIILEQNLAELVSLVEWVNQDSLFTGIAFQALAQPFRTDLVDRWYLEGQYSDLWPKDSGKVCLILDKLIESRAAGSKIVNPPAQLKVYKKYYTAPHTFVRTHQCNFGDYIFNVNALGLVHLCCFREPIGNIKKNKISDLWYSEAAAKTRELMYHCPKSCNNIVNCYFQEEESEA